MTASVIPSAWAIAPIGHGRLVGTASARVEYDSNIFLNSNEVEDTIVSGTGDVRYIHDAGLVGSEIGVGLRASAFADHSSQNTTDPYADARFSYSDSDKSDAKGTVSYRRSTFASEIGLANQRVRSDDFAVAAQFQHLPTEKLGYRINGDYLQSSYLTNGYSDTEGYLLGVNAVHLYSPKLKLLAGLSGGQSESSGITGRDAMKTTDYRYTVGAEGELAPKITGEITTGLAQRSFRTGKLADTSSLFVSSRLSWAETEKRNWTLTGSQEYGVSAADQSTRALKIFLSMSEALSDKLSLDTSVGYTRTNFTSDPALKSTLSRSDDGYSLRARLAYAISANTTVDLSTGYRDNNSTNAFTDYDRFNIGAGITARF